MFKIKGRHLISRYYARHIPLVSKYVYEMSFVRQSSPFYKTILFPTRLIDLSKEFEQDYSRRLRKYIRQAHSMNFTVHRPPEIPDIHAMYQSVVNAKNLPPLPPGIEKHQVGYFYSEIHHPDLGRLAAHISIGDAEERTVFGLVNASEFRIFSTPQDQRICSIANKFLFHQDMVHFKKQNFRYYDMVGVGEPVNQMKKEFRGEIIPTFTHIPWPWYVLQKIKRMVFSIQFQRS